MRALTLTLLALAIPACGKPAQMAPVEPTGVAARYPDLEALFAGEQGIYGGCGPNDGVCHNASRFPDLSSVGAISEVVGAGCNRLRESRAEVHDWCEVPGDFVRLDDRVFEIVRVTELPGGGAWSVTVRGELPAQFDYVAVDRALGDDYASMHEELSERMDVVVDASDTLSLRLTQGDDEDINRDAVVLGDAFRRAGLPGNPTSIQVADSNGNGVEGATLGRGLIVAGRPDHSYIIRRLTDPSFGTLMPLANCCYWSKDSLRALWCWIAGLAPDGQNATAPIDYDSCPPGPDESVVYPEAGPECESSGLCPVMTQEMLSGG